MCVFSTDSAFVGLTAQWFVQARHGGVPQPPPGFVNLNICVVLTGLLWGSDLVMRCLDSFVWKITVSCPPSAHSDASGLSQFTESSCTSLPAVPSGAGEEKGEAHCGGSQPRAVCVFLPGSWRRHLGWGPVSNLVCWHEEGSCSLERQQVPWLTVLHHYEHPW